jgi:hypothetical protein
VPQREDIVQKPLKLLPSVFEAVKHARAIGRLTTAKYQGLVLRGLVEEPCLDMHPSKDFNNPLVDNCCRRPKRPVRFLKEFQSVVKMSLCRIEMGPEEIQRDKGKACNEGHAAGRPVLA